MIENAVRGIGAFIDRAIYSIVEVIMQLIIDLSNLQIFSESTINTFATRIYVILGLVMLFKIMISFIQILINPEKMDDKEQGVGGVLKRVVISLALIYLVPSIFDLARQVQTQILPIIPKVILGVEISPDSDNETSQEAMSSVGRMMAFYSFLPFFNYDNPNCNDGSILGTGNDDNASIWSVGTALEAREATCPDSTSDGQYKYKYSWPLSSLVGAFLIYVLVTIAVAVAIRAIKLGICEFIAPIPIASYIDPKTSGKAFNNWVSTSVKTYLDLFIRLLTVYFVIFVFMTFLDTENLTAMYGKLGNDFWRGTLVTLFVIVALLQFAKQAPKFISDMLGLQEGTMLKDMLTGEGWKQMSVIPGTAAAAAGSFIGNARYGWENNRWYKQGHPVKSAAALLGNTVTRGLGGVFGAVRRGGQAAMNGEGWRSAYTNNVAATTGASRRRVDRSTLHRLSKTEYREMTSGMSAAEKKLVPKPISPARDSLSNIISSFQGRGSFNSQTLRESASALVESRSSLYTGEASSKINGADGLKLDTIRYNYNGNLYNYSQIKTAYDAVANGASSFTFGSGTTAHTVGAAEVRSMFDTAQKKAMVDYVRLVSGKDVTGDDGYVTTAAASDVTNAKISEGIKQLKGKISGMDIPAQMKNEMLRQLDEDPGMFLRGASDVAERINTVAGRRSAFEINQEQGK